MNWPAGIPAAAITGRVAPMTGIRMRRTPPADVGPMLKAARVRADLGLRETARAAQISHPTLYDLERGKSCPSRTVASALAAVLELTDEERVVLDRAAVDDAGRDHPARRRAV